VAFTIILTVLSTVRSHAAQTWDQFRIALEVIPQAPLPAIPVTFRITFTNPTDVPLALPPHALLIATNESGDTFPLDGSLKPIFPGELRTTPVPPRDSAVIDLRPRGSFNDDPYWLNEPRLNHPGHFQLQVVAGKFFSEHGIRTVPESGIRSTAVDLHVVEPTGVDLTVWREMFNVSKGQWSELFIAHPEGWAFAAHVVRDFPDSQYAGWFAARGVHEKATESADALRSWLSQASHDQYTEGRELRLALFEDRAAREWTQIKANEVLRHVANARTLLEKLKNSKDPEIASRARKQLDDLLVPDEEDLRERIPRRPNAP